LLDEVVRGVPVAGQGEIDGAEQVLFWRGHTLKNRFAQIRKQLKSGIFLQKQAKETKR
jgi:hypothetical protein